MGKRKTFGQADLREGWKTFSGDKDFLAFSAKLEKGYPKGCGLRRWPVNDCNEGEQPWSNLRYQVLPNGVLLVELDEGTAVRMDREGFVIWGSSVEDADGNFTFEYREELDEGELAKDFTVVTLEQLLAL